MQTSFLLLVLPSLSLLPETFHSLDRRSMAAAAVVLVSGQDQGQGQAGAGAAAGAGAGGDVALVQRAEEAARVAVLRREAAQLQDMVERVGARVGAGAGMGKGRSTGAVVDRSVLGDVHVALWGGDRSAARTVYRVAAVCWLR